MKGKKILIIDDDIDFGFLMTDFFSKRGGKVMVAKSLTEGLLFLTNKPDYIFLDNNLPDGLGWRETEYILANYPNARLILISSLDVPRTNTTSFGILFKPLIKEELHKMFD